MVTPGMDIRSVSGEKNYMRYHIESGYYPVGHPYHPDFGAYGTGLPGETRGSVTGRMQRANNRGQPGAGQQGHGQQAGGTPSQGIRGTIRNNMGDRDGTGRLPTLLEEEEARVDEEHYYKDEDLYDVDYDVYTARRSQNSSGQVRSREVEVAGSRRAKQRVSVSEFTGRLYNTTISMEMKQRNKRNLS